MHRLGEEWDSQLQVKDPGTRSVQEDQKLVLS